MPNRFRTALARLAAPLARPVTGLIPIAEHEPEDVFVVGFPKSGNTWCQYLIAGLLCGLDTSRCPDRLIQDIVPDVHGRHAYKRYTKPVFFKSHALPQPDYRRVIYLLRDGRDAMVSYYHYYHSLVRPLEFLPLVREAPDLPARWHEHVEAWMANPHRADFLLVKYEDLKQEPVRELRRMAEFAGLKPEDSALAAAVGNAGFEKQQRREKALGWDDPAWPKDRAFVRRGVVGSFKDEMPPEALAEFLREAGPTLAKHGYAV
jgi:hypothetical protein